jgi:hypothetical protein
MFQKYNSKTYRIVKTYTCFNDRSKQFLSLSLSLFLSLSFLFLSVSVVSFLLFCLSLTLTLGNTVLYLLFSSFCNHFQDNLIMIINAEFEKNMRVFKRCESQKNFFFLLLKSRRITFQTSPFLVFKMFQKYKRAD